MPAAAGVCAAAAVLLGLAAGGCGSPSKANIALRKENQELREQVEQLQRQRAADAASLAAMQRQLHGGDGGATTQQARANLPPEVLDRLFTVAGLQLGRLTGVLSPERAGGASAVLRVQATPTDASGQAIKSAGSFVIEAFDLSADGRLVQRWTFDLGQSKAAWHGAAMLYCYLFQCPFDTPPTAAKLTLKVTFTDELTGRQFSEQRPIDVDVSPASAARSAAGATP